MGALSELKGNVLGMDGKPFTPIVIDGNVKLTANRKPKRTKSNAKAGSTTWVDPIRDKEDIGKILTFLQSKIDNTERADYKKAYARNKLYFCLGIFTGFRVSDLIGARKGTAYKKKTKDGIIHYEYPEWTGLKWQDIYCKDGKTFRKEMTIKELKTGNMRKLLITDIMKKYFMEYVDKFTPDTDSNSYIFVNRQKEKISYKSIDNFIKEAVENCKIEGNYSTHSLRKTYVYHKYIGLCNAKGEQFALTKTMKYTGHKTMDAFLRYLGLQEKETEEDTKIFEDYMSDIF